METKMYARVINLLQDGSGLNFDINACTSVTISFCIPFLESMSRPNAVENVISIKKYAFSLVKNKKPFY